MSLDIYDLDVVWGAGGACRPLRNHSATARQLVEQTSCCETSDMIRSFFDVPKLFYSGLVDTKYLVANTYLVKFQS